MKEFLKIEIDERESEYRGNYSHHADHGALMIWAVTHVLSRWERVREP
jgi:hypothetical protein